MTTLFRLASWDTPFWVNPNRSPGRFNEAGRGPVQYWSLHPLTPWAEYLRAQGRRTIDALVEMKARLWTCRLDLSGAVELSFRTASRFGLDPGHLVDDDHSACRSFGEEQLEAGTGSFIVPSAALPGTRNLVLFGPRVIAPFDMEPISEIDGPAAVAAEDARALTGLLEIVRYRGRPHAELEAWERGERFEFEAPSYAA